MRLVALVLAMVFGTWAFAADEPVKKKPVAKKQAAPKKAAHQKPTPEQIRKFNELQKKQ